MVYAAKVNFASDIFEPGFFEGMSKSSSFKEN